MSVTSDVVRGDGEGRGTEKNSEVSNSWRSFLFSGLLWGGLFALSVFALTRAYQKRQSLLTYETDAGNIGISKRAFEELVSSHCEDVDDVVKVRVKSSGSGGRTVIHLKPSLKEGCEIFSVLGEMTSSVYRTAWEMMEIEAEKLTVVLEGLQLLQKCPAGSKENL